MKISIPQLDIPPPSVCRSKDSRPRPLIIPGRRSDVRLLIDFFNTRAFQTDGLLTPRRIPDPIPQNKVRSLVVNFNRLDTFSSPATLVSSPTKEYTPGFRQRTLSMPERIDRVMGVEKAQFGRQLDIKPARRVCGDVEEITVSGGDKRETTYKKSQEPFRSIKIWKDELELRAGSVDQGRERGMCHRERSRSSKMPVDGPSVTNELMEPIQTKSPSRRRRKKHRNRNSADQSDRYSSKQGPEHSPILSQTTERRVQYQRKSRSPVPDLQDPPPSAHEPPVVDFYVRATARGPSRLEKTDDRLFRNPQEPSTAIGDLSPTASKYSFTGSLKGTLMSVFGRASRQDVRRSTKKVTIDEPKSSHKDGAQNKKNWSRKLVPAEFEGSSQSASSDYGNDLAVGNSQRPIHQKYPLIMTTEATPIKANLPNIDVVVEDALSGETLQSGDYQTPACSPGYPASTIRQPRTFKDIALQRREERLKAAQVFPTVEDHQHLSIPPLRVVKVIDPIVPTLQTPVPLRTLYGKSSQETLTSFEEPSIHIPESSESSLDCKIQNVPNKQTEVESACNCPVIDVARPPLRSPTLMREMAVPRLTLRSSVKQVNSNRKQPSKRSPLTNQHFTPRMKLKGDDDWKKRTRRNQKNNLIDGLGDELTPPQQRRRERPKPTPSSSSHDTTVSSEIAARALPKKLNIQPLDTQPESSDIDNPRNQTQRESDYRLISSMQHQASRVNFSTYTQNFPAVEYTSQDDDQRIGDRTTAFDGAGETKAVRARTFSRMGGVRKRIQKFEEQKYGSRGRTKKKKAYRDRPRNLG